MDTLAQAVVVLVALLHFYFLVLEMFLWTGPVGRRTFHMTEEFARASATLAGNQGLYNGFVGAALVWGVVLGPAGVGVRLFALGCVVVAGLYGAVTINKRILYVQAGPGLVGLVLTWLSRGS
jgi:putative membrane protein